MQGIDLNNFYFSMLAMLALEDRKKGTKMFPIRRGAGPRGRAPEFSGSLGPRGWGTKLFPTEGLEGIERTV